MIVIEIWLSCLRSRLKNTSQGFLNPLFRNLLSGEDQTVTNLPYTMRIKKKLRFGITKQEKIDVLHIKLRIMGHFICHVLTKQEKMA